MSKTARRQEGPSPFEPGQKVAETPPQAAAPTDAVQTSVVAEEEVPKRMSPDLIILEVNFGFALNGTLRSWTAGVPITDRKVIAELLARGAPAKCYREISNV